MGIEVWEFTIKRHGQPDLIVEIVDLAGQMEYYVSHAFFMAGRGALYTLVSKAVTRDDADEQQVDDLMHWISFLRASMRKEDTFLPEDEQPLAQLILAMTHTDKIENPKYKAKLLVDMIANELGSATDHPPKFDRTAQVCVPQYNDHDAAERARGVLVSAILQQVNLVSLPPCSACSLLISVLQVTGKFVHEVDSTALAIAAGLADGLKRAEKAPLISLAELTEKLVQGLVAQLGVEKLGEDPTARVHRLVEDLIAVGEIIVIRQTVILDAIRWCSQLLAAFINDVRQRTIEGAYKTDRDIQLACSWANIDVSLEEVGTIKSLLTEKLEVCFEEQAADGSSRICFPCLLPESIAERPAFTANTVRGARFSCHGAMQRVPPSVFNVMTVRARGMEVQGMAMSASEVVLTQFSGSMQVTLKRDPANCHIDLIVKGGQVLDKLWQPKQLRNEAEKWIETIDCAFRDKAPGLERRMREICYQCLEEGRPEPSVLSDFSFSRWRNEAAQCSQCSATLDSRNQLPLCLGAAGTSQLGTHGVPEHECRCAVFISHVGMQATHQVQALHQKMERWLERKNKRLTKVWIDKASLATLEEREESVKRSQYFILFHTMDVLRRSWCVKERYWALKYRKPIIHVYQRDPEHGGWLRWQLHGPLP